MFELFMEENDPTETQRSTVRPSLNSQPARDEEPTIEIIF
jgi:hypothetical protein